MEQDDALLPYTVNPILVVNTPVPLASLDGKVDTTMFNARFTSQLARPLSLAVNYNYNDRDNKTPRAVYPYIGGDSQNQRPYEEGRINLPYSYTKQKADAILTYRISGGTRLKGGVEYYDTSRDYAEVADAEEWAWLAGVKFGGFERASFNFDYRNSSRDVDAYIGNLPLIESHLPGVIHEDEWENHPLLRKYYETDRDRAEFRFRADVFPVPEFNLGLAFSYYKDDYDEGYYGLIRAKIKSGTIDAGWHPRENVALTGFYTIEKYDATQSSISFSDAVTAFDPNRKWWADTRDNVDTWNIALTFSELGAGSGWKGFNVGFDYTYSDTNSVIDVVSNTLPTAPLPDLVAKMRSFSAWASLDVSESSSIRLAVESAKLDSADFATDNVEPNTLANVLLLGESTANYDLLLITGSWTYQF
jgi:MtrB/PioB family decaheme-associated outer membrane protein